MKDYLSVWIIPKEDASPKVYSIERKKLKKILIGAGIGALIGFVMFVDYIGLNLKRERLKRLEAENLKLKSTVAKLQKDAQELHFKLSLFKDYAKKLNTIAGLEAPYALREVGGVGGGLDIGAITKPLPSNPDPQKVVVKMKELKKMAQDLDVNFEILYKFFKEQQDLLSSTPSIWPTRGYLTSGFGYRRDPFTGRRAFHKGIDISAPIGQKVYATAKGIVLKTGYQRRGLGRWVEIDHGFGFTTFYGHLSRILVRPGQRVKRGDVIGYVGSSGRSTGPHLHYEVHVYGKAVNPLLYILENLGI